MLPAAALAALLLLAGCAGAPPAVELPPSQPGDDILHGVENSQVLALWRDAEVARQTRDYSRASVRLEQAIGLEPANPVLWSRMAEIQLLQNEPAKAENLAAKSNALAVENPPLHFRNWLIIRHARKLRGDEEGVALAQKELDRLRASGSE